MCNIPVLGGSLNKPDPMRERLKLTSLVYLLALLKFILPFLLQSPAYEPHRDEFLYLAEGRHLAWGYLEVPPLMSGAKLS